MVTIVHSDSSHFKNLFLWENYLKFGLFVEAHFKSEFNRNLLRGTRETKNQYFLNGFALISKMAPMAAIMKFFKGHLF